MGRRAPADTGGRERRGHGQAVLPGCQELLVSRWRHLLAGRVPAPGVVVLDPGRHRCAGLVPGGEVLHSPQLEFEGGVPRFDDRVIEGGAWPPHRLGDGNPLAGSLERPGGVFGGFNRSSQHLDLEVLRYGCREAPAGDSCDARADVVARPAVDRAARGPRAVLGGDRPRRVERGRGSRDGCVAGRWLEVVPAGWRDAAHLAGPAVGAVPVVR